MVDVTGICILERPMMTRKRNQCLAAASAKGIEKIKMLLIIQACVLLHIANFSELNSKSYEFGRLLAIVNHSDDTVHANGKR